MNVLQKFSSSFFGVYCRKFLVFHIAVFALFGWGNIFYLRGSQIDIKTIYNFGILMLITVFVMTLFYWLTHLESKWTFKRFLYLIRAVLIGTIAGFGFLVSWSFLGTEYKDGYFALAFNIATIQAIVLYILISITDKILKNQMELKEFQIFIKQQFVKGGKH